MTPDQLRTAEDCARVSTIGDAAPQVCGILETALYVKDPRRSAEFYRRLFGFPVLLESERLIALVSPGKAFCCYSRLVRLLNHFRRPEGSFLATGEAAKRISLSR